MPKRFALFIAIGTIACVGDSTVGADAGPDATADAVVTDVAAVDASSDVATEAGPACDLQKPFGAPTLVPNVNSTGNDFARPWADTTLYVWSDRANGAGGVDFWLATRPTITSTFSAPTNVTASPTGLNSATTDMCVSLTTDGLTAYFSTSRARTDGINDVWVATRANTTADFTNGAAVANVNDTNLGDDAFPWISGDGATLYFASNRTGNYDIYGSTKTGTTFAPATAVTELSTASYEMSPVLDPSQLTIYFASKRTDGGALGGFDIWMATRASTTTAFSAPTNLTAMNSGGDDYPTGLSTDGCVLYLASDRTGTMGGEDIWQAVRPK